MARPAAFTWCMWKSAAAAQGEPLLAAAVVAARGWSSPHLGTTCCVCTDNLAHAGFYRPSPLCCAALCCAALRCRCLTGHTTGGVWLSFFLAQVPLIACERLVLAALQRRGVPLPRPVRIAYTISTECMVVWYLFWRPSDEAGITEQTVASVKGSIAALASLLGF